MAAKFKSKEIQVQKPAQSLQAFQKKLEYGQEEHATLLKPVLIGTGVITVLAMSFFGFRSWRASSVEKHETAMSRLLVQVRGDGMQPMPAAEQEKKMRELLPQMEKLAADAPSPSKAVAKGILSSWKLQLDGKGSPSEKASDEWDKLRAAQRQLALGQADEAANSLASLKGSASPETPWSSAYWNALMEVHRLKGDRASALKDYSDYKAKFKDKADASLEKVVASI